VSYTGTPFLSSRPAPVVSLIKVLGKNPSFQASILTVLPERPVHTSSKSILVAAGLFLSLGVAALAGPAGATATGVAVMILLLALTYAAKTALPEARALPARRNARVPLANATPCHSNGGQS